MRNVTGDAFIPENLILPQSIVPLCEDSARVAVLSTLPTLDDGGLAPRQTGGDPNRGSSYAERCGVRRHYEGEAGRG